MFFKKLMNYAVKFAKTSHENSMVHIEKAHSFFLKRSFKTVAGLNYLAVNSRFIELPLSSFQ